MTERVIDGTGAVAGRLASYAAKKALLGETVTVCNCEKLVITGNPRYVFQRYHHLIKETGQPQKGPFISKMPDRFFRRIIRGMLPHERTRGREAFKRVMCYIGTPTEYKDKQLEKVETCSMTKRNILKYQTLEELSKSLGERL